MAEHSLGSRMKAYEAVSDGRLHLLAQEAAEIVQAAVKAARAIERGEHSPDQGEEVDRD